MALKKAGYYISKGRCVRAYHMKKYNRKSKKYVKKLVNYKKKAIKKGTKIYKSKTECTKEINRKKVKKSRPKVKKVRKTRFGQDKTCAYSVPFFGNMVPSIAKSWSGTPNSGFSSIAWAWPQPGAFKLDTQVGGWNKVALN